MLLSFFKKKNQSAPFSRETVIENWINSGRPVPPPHYIKQDTIQEMANRYKLNTLIETGTYLGEMVEAQLNHFERIYSIELNEKLFRKAVRKFRASEHVHLLKGDSGKVMASLIRQINTPSLFWLDGHYSGGITSRGEKECPVIEELDIITSTNLPHVILIDDARLFNGSHDYPAAEQILSLCRNTAFTYQMEIKDDIIRLLPDNPTQE